MDACPPDYHAIELQQTDSGEFRPYVKERLCTGCGICEYKCPVEGGPAIRVIAVKEMIAAKKIYQRMATTLSQSTPP